MDFEEKWDMIVTENRKYIRFIIINLRCKKFYFNLKKIKI